MAVRKEGLKRDLQNLFQSGLAASLLAGGAKHTEAWAAARKRARWDRAEAGSPLGWGRTKGGTDGRVAWPWEEQRP